MTTKIVVPPVVEQLQKARDLVARGWVQGTFGDQSGDKPRYCILGALLKATGTDWQFKRVDYGLAGHYLNRVVDKPILTWNDQSGRTQAEVVAAFDRAIALALKAPQIKGYDHNDQNLSGSAATTSSQAAD